MSFNAVIGRQVLLRGICPALCKIMGDVETPELLSWKERTPVEQDFTQKIAVVVNRGLEPWIAMNAVAHVTAYLGNQLKDRFASGDHFVTQDGKKHPRNSQYPIIVLSAKPGQMKNLMEKVRNSGLLYIGFIREMIETSDDEEIARTLGQKLDQDIEYLAVGIFGVTGQVDSLTKNFSLWKSVPSQ